MKKIIGSSLMLSILLGGALPAMAQTTSNSALDCVQAAVEKRESSIIAAWSALNVSIVSALETRKADLYKAWDITNRKERRAAIKSAWQTFRTSKWEARKTFNASRKAAWDTFGAEAKACGLKVSAEEPRSVISEMSNISL